MSLDSVREVAVTCAVGEPARGDRAVGMGARMVGAPGGSLRSVGVGSWG